MTMSVSMVILWLCRWLQLWTFLWRAVVMSVAVAVSVDISEGGTLPHNQSQQQPTHTAHHTGTQDDCSGAGISLGEVSGLGYSSDVNFDE